MVTDEMYEIVHQARYRFFGIDELYKLVMHEMYKIGRFIVKFKANILLNTILISYQSKSHYVSASPEDPNFTVGINYIEYYFN